MNTGKPFVLVASLAWALHLCSPHAAAAPPFADTVVACAPNASPLEQFAAREVRRYIYVATGRLAPLRTLATAGDTPRHLLLVCRRDRDLARQYLGEPAAGLAPLAPQEYLLHTVEPQGRRVLVLSGGDDTATLYAAYRYAEHLGVRFYLHGDVVPDPVSRGALLPSEGLLPRLDERFSPLFPVRGIQPFHDFPEGPDWWNRDDYLSVIGQLPKLRMNFFGLHTYPEGGPNAEPTVWIGLKEDIRERGEVNFAYPSSYQNSLRGNWGYAAKPTGQYPFGARQLFERDDFGNDAMLDLAPEPTNSAAAAQLFGRVGDILADVFGHARRLGIKTCVGTETPLTIPKALQTYLKDKGLNPTNAATVRALYEGMFERIGRTHPLDYFWFWTPETWTWDDVKPEHVAHTLDDLRIAREAVEAVQAKFQLATCGWVLGPPEDRALFDKTFPKSWPLSCINRELGRTPVEPGFAHATGRPKWAIPWLEDDPSLTAAQLWAGRMRQDAVDSLRYGCDGLLGIHWRTRSVAPAVSALAQAAWNQDPWKCDTSRVPGWVGGKIAEFPTNAITGAPDPTVYRTVRYGMSSCRLFVPKGIYRVVLQFCEPAFDAKEKRVFSVKLQERKVIDHLDLFAAVGKNHACDRQFDGVRVEDGLLAIDFIPHVEKPALAGLIVSSPDFTLKVNCGGKAHQDYVEDFSPLPRNQPTADLYLDWAMTEFGPEAAEPIADLFTALDGKLPTPADWIDGPGNVRKESRPWDEVAKDYAFVDRLARLEPWVQGAANRERFHYWLRTFLLLREQAQLGCLWADLDRVMEKLKADKDDLWKTQLARSMALPLRTEIGRGLARAYGHLLAKVSNPGELGNVANWAQHVPVKLLEQYDADLAKCLGGSLPPETRLSLEYTGGNRIVVPTTRPSLRRGEDLALKVILLSRNPVRQAELCWRPLGKGGYRTVPLDYVARSVYRVRLPAADIADRDLEYHVRAVFAQGDTQVFPPTAPTLNQTVVVQP